jgi:hypothetical protein
LPDEITIHKAYCSHLSPVLRCYLLLTCLLATFCHAADESARHQVHAEMRNISYHFSDTVAVHIVHLEGELVPAPSPGLPVFDDPNSFSISVRSAEIWINTAALANVLNEYVFAAKDAPIKGIRVSTEGGKIKLRGRLHSKGDIPFESEGTLSVTADGNIRVHTEEVKAAHLPVKGLMDLIGATISKLIDTRKVRGLRAEKDDLILIPSELFPPPHLYGKVTSVSIRGDQIVQRYGQPGTPTLKIAGNYMAYRGAQLRFGKLTMSDTDLTLIDMDPGDPFDFYLEHYQDQLVAGYTKTTRAFGLQSYFRDYNKLTPSQKTKPRK